MSEKVAVIGGGAAGLISAIIAARRGKAVSILERMPRTGKKLLATGNGRCNVTNIEISPVHYHGGQKDRMMQAFEQFSHEDTIRFFQEIGIDLICESDGKMYPYSLQASSVLDNLRYEANRLEVAEICEFDVASIRKNGNRFLITSYDGKTVQSDKVILAAGGRAASHLGSNGSGYSLAQSLGHSVTKTFPSLVKLQLKEPFLKEIAGVKLNGTVTADQTCKSKADEILFTGNGVSGPAVFEISRFASEKIVQGKDVSIQLDLFPEIALAELIEKLCTRFRVLDYKTLEENWNGFLNKKLIRAFLRSQAYEPKMSSASLTQKDAEKLARGLKEWTFHAVSTAGFKEAQVCCGGIRLDEINPLTMESKKCRGLFVAGEIMDVDGDCGGYNLQWAWTSGAIAGKHV